MDRYCKRAGNNVPDIIIVLLQVCLWQHKLPLSSDRLYDFYVLQDCVLCFLCCSWKLTQASV